MTRNRQAVSSFEALRRKMIRETEVALLYGLRFPDRVPRIPAVPVSEAHFSREYASRFWGDLLGLAYPDED